jgi:hypothetical protein
MDGRTRAKLTVLLFPSLHHFGFNFFPTRTAKEARSASARASSFHGNASLTQDQNLRRRR